MVVDHITTWVGFDGIAHFDIEGVEGGQRTIRRFDISQSALDHVLIKLTTLAMDARKAARPQRSE